MDAKTYIRFGDFYLYNEIEFSVLEILCVGKMECIALTFVRSLIRSAHHLIIRFQSCTTGITGTLKANWTSQGTELKGPSRLSALRSILTA